MTPASAERLARRLHQYDLDGAGTGRDRGSETFDREVSAGYPYIETLEQVAAIVTEKGGSARQVMAAWLHGVRRTGLLPRSLAGNRVPDAVIDIIEAVSPRSRRTTPERHAARVRACPGAPLVLLAIVTERHHRLARYDSHLVRRDRELLTLTGLPLPSELLPADPVTLLAQAGPEHPNRFRALRALADEGDPAVVRLLVDAHLAARAEDPRWSPGLYHGRRDYQLEWMLSEVVRNPRRPDDPELLTVLLELAGGESAYLRSCGIAGLALVPKYMSLVEQALRDESPVVARAAVRALPADRVPANAGQLTAIAERPGRDREWGAARGGAIQRLVEADDPRGRGLLLAAIAEGGADIDAKVIESLARAGDGVLIQALITAVHQHGPYHAVAASVLGRLRIQAAVPALVHYLDTQAYGPHDVYLRALGQIADPAAIGAIERIWRAQHPVRRRWALRALAHFDDPRVTEIGMEAAEHPDPSIREHAIRVLAARGDNRAAMHLVAACEGPLATVALKGLVRLRDERAAPKLCELMERTADRKVLHLVGRAIVASSRSRYHGLWWRELSLPQLRAALWVEGELGFPRENDGLSEYLLHHDELVRARAATAIGKCGAVGSAVGLSLALADISPRVRATAATALGRVAVASVSDAGETGTGADGRAQARDWLTPLTDDPHPSVRMAATAALRRLAVDAG